MRPSWQNPEDVDNTTYPGYPIGLSSGADSRPGACLKPFQTQPAEGEDTTEVASGGIAVTGSEGRGRERTIDSRKVFDLGLMINLK